MGLKHPGNYNGDDTGPGPFLPYDEDNTTNTLMSYNDEGAYATTPMPYDILAVQHLYGAKSVNGGNSFYAFKKADEYNDGNQINRSLLTTKQTLVDNGGIDTVSFANAADATEGYYIDLRPGGIVTETWALDSLRYWPINNGPGPKPLSQQTSYFGTRLDFNTRIEHFVGSASQDTVLGNRANNKLSGKGGDDYIYGFEGNDEIVGGMGNDRLEGGDGDDILYGEVGDDVLMGAAGRDVLKGGSGNDTLDGGAGRDRMFGGAGDDTYFVDSADDRVIEGSGAGNDVVRSTVNLKLAAHIEQLVLSGSAYRGQGNSLDNVLQGNEGRNLLEGLSGDDWLWGAAGADVLKGGNGSDWLIGEQGNDVLYGGFGEDSLTGGAGADKFEVASVYEGYDYIEDFSRHQGDKFWLHASGFNSLRRGRLPAEAFVLGKAAKDENDRIIYDRSYGSLLFDPDGTGNRRALQFAQLYNGAALSHTDFVVV